MTSPSPSAKHPQSARKTGLLLLLVLTVVAGVYWPGLSGGFAFDDYPNIVLNKALHVTDNTLSDWVLAAMSSPASDLQRPLAMLSFAVNHYFSGLDSWPMKLTNLGLHLLNAVLLFFLIRNVVSATARRLPNPDWIALFVCACWALMPINLTAVLLIVQRMEILSQTFVLCGLLLYVCGRIRRWHGSPGWGHILPGIVLGTMFGALSKETAVLLPIYAFFIELFIFRFRKHDGTFDRALVVFFTAILILPGILGLAWLLPRITDPAAFANRDFTLLERLLTEPRVLLDYIHWSIAPNLSQLTLFHDDYRVSKGFLDPVSTVISAVVLSALALLGWLMRLRRPLATLAIYWFLAAHLLTATIIPLELVFEHRNYFSSIGISLALAEIILVSSSSKRWLSVRTAVAFSLLLFYAATTHLRAFEWSSPLRFAQTEAVKSPQSPRATYQLAQALAILSGGDAKSPLTEAAFGAYARAQQVPGSNILPAQGALLLAVRANRPLKQSWWNDIQKRLISRPIGPQDISAMSTLTDCHVEGRCHFPAAEMLGMYGAALSQRSHPEVLNIYANYALRELRDVELAERLWKEAHELNPREPQYVISLAKLMIALGRIPEAEAQIRRLRAIGKVGQYSGIAADLDTRLKLSQTPVR